MSARKKKQYVKVLLKKYSPHLKSIKSAWLTLVRNPSCVAPKWRSTSLAIDHQYMDRATSTVVMMQVSRVRYWRHHSTETSCRVRAVAASSFSPNPVVVWRKPTTCSKTTTTNHQTGSSFVVRQLVVNVGRSADRRRCASHSRGAGSIACRTFFFQRLASCLRCILHSSSSRSSIVAANTSQPLPWLLCSNVKQRMCTFKEAYTRRLV